MNRTQERETFDSCYRIAYVSKREFSKDFLIDLRFRQFIKVLEVELYSNESYSGRTKSVKYGSNAAADIAYYSTITHKHSQNFATLLPTWTIYAGLPDDYIKSHKPIYDIRGSNEFPCCIKSAPLCFIKFKIMSSYVSSTAGFPLLGLVFPLHPSSMIVISGKHIADRPALIR